MIKNIQSCPTMQQSQSQSSLCEVDITSIPPSRSPQFCGTWEGYIFQFRVPWSGQGQLMTLLVDYEHKWVVSLAVQIMKIPLLTFQPCFPLGGECGSGAFRWWSHMNRFDHYAIEQEAQCSGPNLEQTGHLRNKLCNKPLRSDRGCCCCCSVITAQAQPSLTKKTGHDYHWLHWSPGQPKTSGSGSCSIMKSWLPEYPSLPGHYQHPILFSSGYISGMVPLYFYLFTPVRE